MKLIAVFSLVVFVATFAAVYGYNTTQAQRIELTPPYAFVPDDLFNELVALAFVFAFSLLFFGFAAPLALAIEGAKFGSLYSNGAVHWTYLFLAIPPVFIALSSTYFGQGLLNDYQGKGLWHQYANKAVISLIIGLLLWTAAFFGRAYLPI